MADERNDQNLDNNQAGAGEQGGESGEQGVTVEELMRQLAEIKVENSRNKAALDKALKNNGDLTKQLRSKMTAAEQDAEAKREQEEQQKQRISELEDFKRRAEAKERYMLMGMNAEFAKQAVEAEVSGDMDALASVMKQYNEASLKAQKAEFLKNQPSINAGHGEEGDELTKLEKEIDAAMGL